MKCSFSLKGFFLLAMGLLVVHTTGLAQSHAKLEQVKELFYHAHYDQALSLLKNTRQLHRDHKEGRFLMALCYYQLNQLNEAQRLLEELHTERSPYPEGTLYLARIHHAQHQFAEAAKLYKTYLRNLRPQHEHRAMVIEEIRRCDNGIRIQYRPGLAVVENLGPQVNSAEDEFAPVQSPTQNNRLYFSSIRARNIGGLRNAQGRTDNLLGQPTSDLYSCYSDAGRWQGTEPMHYLLNSPQHEVLQDFFAQGKALLYFQGNDLNRGDILIDTFQRLDERRMNSVVFETPIEPQRGDRALYVYNDTLIFFASRRAGGYGGLDIWKTSLRYGRWTYPVNLGPQINSSFDETTPYLARDGRTLYFSSNDSKRGIGGLDILKAVWLPEVKRWSQPINLGVPLNSAADDAYFRLSRDGFSAFFASARKDGYGQRDVYAAYFQDFLPEMEAPVSVQAPAPPPAVSVPGSNEPGIVRPVVQSSPPTSVPPRQTTSLPAPAVAATNTANAEPSNFRLHLSSQAFAPVGVDLQKLEGISRLLRENPLLHLIITAYAPRDLKVSTALFQGLAQAEAAAAYFEEQGITFDRIYLRSLPQKESDDWQLEFAFRGEAAPALVGKLPEIGGNLPMRNASAPYNQKLFYKVQVISVQKPWSHQALTEFPYPMAETLPGFGYHRITLGAFPTFAEAKQFQKHLQTRGFARAFIIAYVQGERADKHLAKQHLSFYPDLANYLGQ